MLTFATEVKIQEYLSRKNARNYREFEAEIAEKGDDSLIKGMGVLATRAEIEKSLPRYEQDFFHDEVDVGAHELGAYVDTFPLAAASASHVFTLIEVFGNDVAEIIKSGGIAQNKAWHEDVRGFADLRDPVQLQKARAGFGKHFGAPASDVPEIAARRMVEIKKIRNDYSHEAKASVDFSNFLHDAVAIVCHIAFLTTNLDRISVYPWEDYLDTFKPQSKS